MSEKWHIIPKTVMCNKIGSVLWSITFILNIF